MVSVRNAVQWYPSIEIIPLYSLQLKKHICEWYDSNYTFYIIKLMVYLYANIFGVMGKEVFRAYRAPS